MQVLRILFCASLALLTVPLQGLVPVSSHFVTIPSEDPLVVNAGDPLSSDVEAGQVFAAPAVSTDAAVVEFFKAGSLGGSSLASAGAAFATLEVRRDPLSSPITPAAGEIPEPMATGAVLGLGALLAVFVLRRRKA